MKTTTKAENHRMPLREDWGTPSGVIAAVTSFMGAIDLDPCSNERFNTIVCAGMFYDSVANGLALPWFGRVFCNPPGGTRGGALKWWNRLLDAHRSGEFSEAIYLSFSLDILQASQTEKSGAPLLDFPTIVFANRLKFLDSVTLAPQKTPWKPCAVTWVANDNVRGERTIGHLGDLLRMFGESGYVLR
jgi:hypothetical protein